MATIVAVHDLSGVGRCSLVAAISVLSAAGHTCYPLPTAVLSQQTAFPRYSFLDFTPQFPAYLKGWRAIGIEPDMIFTGFLGGPEQPQLLAEYIDRNPGATVVVDPVMGDHGAIYPCYGPEYVDKMRALASRAHILTPNPTEFLLLAGYASDSPFPREDAALLKLAAALDTPRLRQVVITGLTGLDGRTDNVIVDPEAGEVLRVPCRHTGVPFGGAGDLFSSVLCGCVASGMDLPAAVKAGGDFVSAVAREMPPDADPRYGLEYERHLGRLITFMKGSEW